MAGVFGAEWLKLRKRLGARLMGVIWLALIFFFGYLLPYYFITHGSHPRGNFSGPGTAQQLAPLLPGNLVRQMLSAFYVLGEILLLILAALVGGSEYDWGTLKVILTQRPDRTSVLAAKVLAMGLLLVLFVALGLAAAGAGSVVVALLNHTAIVLPSPGEILRGGGALLLIFATWTAFGLWLSILVRGTSLAIGMGLLYALIVEQIIRGMSFTNDVARAISTALPGTNAAALAGSFTGSPNGFRGGFNGTVIGAGQATLVLAGYVVVFMALAAALWRRRDVT